MPPVSSHTTVVSPPEEFRNHSIPRLRCAVRAEISKLMSTSLTLYAMAGTIIVSIAASWVLTTLIDAALRAGRPEETAGLDIGSAFLVILHYGQIGAVLVAAGVIHQELSPGCLRSTVLAVPQRGVVFMSKAMVVAVVTAAMAVMSAFGSAAIRCLVTDCSTRKSSFAPTAADEVKMLIGLVIYWTLIALFTYALAVVLRSGLAAMGIVLALSLAVSSYLLRVTPVAKFLPDQAGAQLYQQLPSMPGDLGPAVGALVLSTWTLVALIAAFLAFRHQPVHH